MSESTRGIILRIPYMVALKDAPVAILCSQIHYWYTPSKTGKTKLKMRKEGKLWIVKSAREWSEETGLTRAQVKRSIAVLVRLGVIETLLRGFNAAPTGHLRALRVNGNMLKAGEYLIPIAGDSQSQASNPLAIGDESMDLNSSPLATDSQSNTVTTQEISTETTQDSLASNDAGLPKTQIPKHPPEKKNKNDEVVGTLEVEEDISVDISSKLMAAILLREVWNQLTKQYSEQYGEYLPLKAKELVQLNMIFKDLGSRSEPILRLLFLRWSRFSKYAKNSHGAYSIPALPTINFIVRNPQIALHFWNLECQENVSVFHSNSSSEDCIQISDQKHSVAEAVQPASNLPTGPQPKADSPKCSESEDVDNSTPITNEEIEAARKLRLAKKKVKEDFLQSKIPALVISTSLVSPADDEPLKCGPLAPCPLVPELTSTTTATVADATKGDNFGDWEDWGDSEF